MFASLTQLTQTGGFTGPYLLVFACGLLAAGKLREAEQSGSTPLVLSKFQFRLAGFAAVFFCTMVVCSHYPVWLEPPLGAATPKILKLVYGFIMLCVLSAGTFLAAFDIFKFLALFPRKIMWKKAERPCWEPRKVFLFTFLSICAINLFVLLFLKYPGLMEPDSYVQIEQVLTGRYQNHHPVFHTILLKPGIMLGQMLFHDLNAGVAIYCAIQVVIMAGIFSYTVMTLAQLRAPRTFVVLAAAYYALAPYHTLLSITVYKDVYFCGCMLLWTLKLYQLLQGYSHSKWDYLVYFISGVGSCLLRSNGMIAMAISAVMLVLCFGMKKKQLLLILVVSIAVSFGAKHVLLTSLSISGPDTVESLSIPAQQIARVIIDHNDLTEEEAEILSRAFPIDAVPDNYFSDLSDPMKGLIRKTIAETPEVPGWPMDFVGVYLRLGLRHPVTYFKAWIDQTRGYWCSGYTTPVWFVNSFPNGLGLHHTKLLPQLSAIFDYILGCFDDFDFFEPLFSPGFCTWLFLISLYYALLRMDRPGILICIPSLAVLATLLLATPMANEFHYYYCAFCIIPVVLTVVTRDEKDLSPVQSGKN